MNIFILCAGKGSRFDSILPKPLNLVNGNNLNELTVNKEIIRSKIFITIDIQTNSQF